MEHTLPPLKPTRPLQLRAGVYYFRQRLPHDVASRLDQREIVRSLNTSHYPTALARKTRVQSALKRAIALLRQTDPEDIANTRQVFRRWFERQLERDFLKRQEFTFGPKAVEKTPVMGAVDETAVKIGARFFRAQSEIEAGHIADSLLRVA